MATRSEEGETEKKEKLYVLMYHVDAGPYVHTLYALDIPGESTSELPPPEIGPFRDLDAADNVKGRESVDPIISFPRKRFPGLMACVRFESKLYFMGGIIGFDRETAHYTPDVYILDLTKETTFTRLASLPPERKWEVLEKGPRMHTGKFSPIAFEFRGSILVLSGHSVCPDTGVDLTPCEVFLPGLGTWVELQLPPVGKTLYNYVVIGNLVFIVDEDRVTWLLEARKIGRSMDVRWSRRDSVGFSLAESCFFVKGTLYSCFKARGVVALKYRAAGGGEVFGDMVELEVLKSRIISKEPTSLLVYMGGSKQQFCFLQAASPSVIDPDRLSISDSPVTGHFNLTVFEADPADNPKFLYAAHYSTKIDYCYFIATHAHIVLSNGWFIGFVDGFLKQSCS